MSVLPPQTLQGRQGSPQEAAYNSIAQRNHQNHQLQQVSRGGSMKKKGGAIPVAQVQTMYKSPAGPGGSVNDINTNNHQTAATSEAQAKYDNQLGGGKRCKRGGNPDWLWGCYSGGKKRKTRTNKRKTRRYRKKTRRNKK